MEKYNISNPWLQPQQWSWKSIDSQKYQYFYDNSTPQYCVCKRCGTNDSINGRIRDGNKYFTYNCLNCWFKKDGFSSLYILNESSFDYSEKTLKKYTYKIIRKKIWEQTDMYGWRIEVTNKETKEKREDWLLFDQNFRRNQTVLRNYVNADIDPFLEKLFRLAGHENVEVFDDSKLKVATEQIPLITANESSLPRFEEIAKSYEDNSKEDFTIVKELRTENLRLINEKKSNSNPQPSSLIVFLLLIFIILMLGGIIHRIIRFKKSTVKLN